MRTMLFTLLFWCGLSLTRADETAADTSMTRADETAADLLKRDGKLVVSDGSSYYLFDHDGSFQSGPLGISGRTIHGRWKADGDSNFVIEGVWSWLNGLSLADDRRRLTLHLGPPFVIVPRRSGGLDTPGSSNGKLYSCYLIVDELVKVKPSK